jgi:lipase
VRRSVLALHGVSASHLAWATVARVLTADDGVRVLAPDLRGRGHSSTLPGPWGMARHADDAAAALDAVGASDVDVIGHSMGGFAAVAFAGRHAARMRSLLLVDGGVPIPLPPGMNAGDALAATLGPAAARLQMTFSTAEQYRQFWMGHPAFATDWTPDVTAYVDYDLTGEPPELRSRCSLDAVVHDSEQLSGDTSLLQWWDGLEREVVFLRAPFGLLGGLPALYAPSALDGWRERAPMLRWHDVPDVNHYTITLSERGAVAVAAEWAGPARS